MKIGKKTNSRVMKIKIDVEFHGQTYQVSLTSQKHAEQDELVSRIEDVMASLSRGRNIPDNALLNQRLDELGKLRRHIQKMEFKVPLSSLAVLSEFNDEDDWRTNEEYTQDLFFFREMNPSYDKGSFQKHGNEDDDESAEDFIAEKAAEPILGAEETEREDIPKHVDDEHDEAGAGARTANRKEPDSLAVKTAKKEQQVPAKQQAEQSAVLSSDFPPDLQTAVAVTQDLQTLKGEAYTSGMRMFGTFRMRLPKLVLPKPCIPRQMRARSFSQVYPEHTS